MQIYKIQQSCPPKKNRKIGEITIEYFVSTKITKQ